ncbi:hypothetical protein Z046_00720 [Pseudomonas aeruginosa VRFPA09]|nr:hypothetical protein Z046_00720 [Pseudomonas aeruginosa VRFPA09]
MRTSTLLLPDGKANGRSKLPSASTFSGMLTPFTTSVAGRSLGWLSIAPRMRAVVAWSAATLTEDAG